MDGPGDRAPARRRLRRGRSTGAVHTHTVCFAPLIRKRWPIWGMCKPLLVAAALIVSSAKAEPSAPRIEFAETSFDFGDIYDGEGVAHRFRFQNIGTANLRVGPIVPDVVRAWCGQPDSLSATGTLSVIPPHGWGEIVATFRSEGFALPGFDGQIAQTVHVYSNDLSRLHVPLQVRGRVQAPLVPDPPVAVVGEVIKWRATCRRTCRPFVSLHPRGILSRSRTSRRIPPSAANDQSDRGRKWRLPADRSARSRHPGRGDWRAPSLWSPPPTPRSRCSPSPSRAKCVYGVLSSPRRLLSNLDS